MIPFLPLRVSFLFIAIVIMSIHGTFPSGAMQLEEATSVDYLRARIALQRRIMKADFSHDDRLTDIREAEEAKLRALEGHLRRYEEASRQKDTFSREWEALIGMYKQFDQVAVARASAAASPVLGGGAVVSSPLQIIIAQQQDHVRRLQKHSSFRDVCAAEQKVLRCLNQHERDISERGDDTLARAYEKLSSAAGSPLSSPALPTTDLLETEDTRKKPATRKIQTLKRCVWIALQSCFKGKAKRE